MNVANIFELSSKDGNITPEKSIPITTNAVSLQNSLKFGVFAIDEILCYQRSPLAKSRTLCHPAPQNKYSTQWGIFRPEVLRTVMMPVCFCVIFVICMIYSILILTFFWFFAIFISASYYINVGHAFEIKVILISLKRNVIGLQH